jgi:hypothetical protein
MFVVGARLTSGTASWPVATTLLSLRPAYRFRKGEKAESVARLGWTETMTSLERYAIRETAMVSVCHSKGIVKGPDVPASSGVRI